MMHFRPLPTLTLTLLLTAVLAACNTDAPAPNAKDTTPPTGSQATTASVSTGKPTAPPPGDHTGDPVRRFSAQAITAGSPNVHTIEFDLSAHSVTHIQGKPDLVNDLPAGMHAAYRFSGDNVKMRVNIPSSAFPDNRGRVAVLNSSASNPANSTGGVLFADTLQPDPGISSNEVASLMQGVSGVPSNSGSPYTSQSSAAFSQQSQNSGASTGTAARAPGESGPAYVTAQRTTTTNNGQNTINTTLYFDPQYGMITKQSSSLSAPEATATNSSQISYTTPSDQPTLQIPTGIYSSQTISSRRAGENPITIEVQTTYANTQINTLADSYFNVGGL